MKDKSILVTLSGSFQFTINQHGLDYDNSKEKQHAIDDFFGQLQETIRTIEDQHGFLCLEYDPKNVVVELGE